MRFTISVLITLIIVGAWSRPSSAQLLLSDRVYAQKVFVSTSGMPIEDIEGSKQQFPFQEVMKKSVIKAMAPLFNQFTNDFVTGDLSFNSVIMKSLSALDQSLIETIEAYQEQLPSEQQRLMISFLPQPKNDAIYFPQPLWYSGLNYMGSTYGRPDEISTVSGYHIKGFVAQKYNESSQAQPYYLVGIIINIFVQKNRSYIEAHFLIGLNPREIEFKQENDQVAFTHLVIPRTNFPQQAPVAQLKFERNLTQNEPLKLNVQFGSFGRILTKLTAFEPATRIKGYIICGPSHKSSIYLKGTLKEGAAAGFLGKVASGKAVDFHLSNLDFSIDRKAQLTRMNLGISVGFNTQNSRITGGCVENDGLSEQFKKEINKAIEAKENTVNEMVNGTLDKVMDTLLSKAVN